jgi:hypothetical protein
MDWEGEQGSSFGLIWDPSIYREGRRKTAKIPIQDSRGPVRDSNRTAPEYKDKECNRRKLRIISPFMQCVKYVKVL